MTRTLPPVNVESEIVGVELPPRVINPAAGRYGVLDLSARYCGLRSIPTPLFGEWQHGWHPQQHNWHPELVIGNDGRSRSTRHYFRQLVARQDQEAYLRSEGYANVHAVGLPIVYQPKPDIERLPGSLLVMPAHSLRYTTHGWDFVRYAEEIAAIAMDFSTVVACVAQACYERNYWVDAFEKVGIPVVSGAMVTDCRSYDRLAALFSRFEYVTTNCMGSPLIYAPLFGARSCICGTYAEYAAEDFRDDPFYLNCPEILEWQFARPEKEMAREWFPELFCHPRSAPDNSAWAAWQAGVQCKQEPDDLQRLLGWTLWGILSHKMRRTVRPVRRKVGKYLRKSAALMTAAQ